MRGVKSNLVGLNFGTRVVLEKVGKADYSYDALWKYRCVKCGCEGTTKATHLKLSAEQPCKGCQSKAKLNKISIGDVYGKLTALSPSGRDRHGNYLWKVKCSCGIEFITGGGQYLQKTRAHQNLLGMRTPPHPGL